MGCDICELCVRSLINLKYLIKQCKDKCWKDDIKNTMEINFNFRSSSSFRFGNNSSPSTSNNNELNKFLEYLPKTK